MPVGGIRRNLGLALGFGVIGWLWIDLVSIWVERDICLVWWRKGIKRIKNFIWWSGIGVVCLWCQYSSKQVSKQYQIC